MSEIIPRRPIGRPSKGSRIVVSIRMSDAMNSDFVDLAEHLGETKSDTLAALVTIGLDYPAELNSVYEEIVSAPAGTSPGAAHSGLLDGRFRLQEYLFRIPKSIDQRVQQVVVPDSLRKPVALAALTVIGSQHLDDFPSALALMRDAALRPTSAQAPTGESEGHRR